MPHYLLGIDNGNTVCKATLFDLRGKVVALASTKIKTYYPQAGWSERNVAELWRANARNIRKLLQQSGVNPADILGVGGTGHGNGLYLLNRTGTPMLGIQSLDSRAGEVLDDWQKKDLQAKVFPKTRQKFWASQSNTLLAWMKVKQPGQYAQIGHVLLCKDLINYHLTGQIATDFSDISATNLLNIYTRAYDDDLLECYDLRDSRPALPPIYHSHDIIGGVSKLAAKQTGLMAGTPVVAGMLDVDASMIGSGVYQLGQTAVVAGTWSVNGTIVKEPFPDSALAMTALFATGEAYLSLEASATSITNLEWFIQQFCSAEQRSVKRKGLSMHQLCDDWVQNRSARSTLIFHPFLHGSNVQANARAGFYGLGAWHTRADMLSAVYEGIAFGHLQHLNNLRKAGAEIDQVRMTGGGARSTVLTQLFADVLNIKVEVPQVQETGTWGAALAAGVGIRTFGNYAVGLSNTLTIAREHEPDPKRVAIYRQQYLIYQDLLERMSGAWDLFNSSSRRNKSNP